MQIQLATNCGIFTCVTLNNLPIDTTSLIPTVRDIRDYMSYVSLCRHALGSLLPAIAASYSNHVLHDAHLHSLTTIWACSQEEFSNAEFCEIVFDNFLLTMNSQESVLRQTLRLLHFVYSKMDSNKVVAILTATQPSPEVRCTVCIYIVCTLHCGYILPQFLFSNQGPVV